MAPRSESLIELISKHYKSKGGSDDAFRSFAARKGIALRLVKY
jgi:hypothetical protein